MALITCHASDVLARVGVSPAPSEITRTGLQDDIPCPRVLSKVGRRNMARLPKRPQTGSATQLQTQDWWPCNVTLCSGRSPQFLLQFFGALAGEDNMWLPLFEIGHHNRMGPILPPPCGQYAVPQLSASCHFRLAPIAHESVMNPSTILSWTVPQWIDLRPPSKGEKLPHTGRSAPAHTARRGLGSLVVPVRVFLSSNRMRMASS